MRRECRRRLVDATLKEGLQDVEMLLEGADEKSGLPRGPGTRERDLLQDLVVHVSQRGVASQLYDSVMKVEVVRMSVGVR